MTFDWRNEDDETIEYHLNPRMTVPDTVEFLGAMAARSQLAREELEGRLDIRYGARPKETLDVFPAASDALGSTPPAQIFIHGGYWRMSDKGDVSHLATDVVAAGATHISLNYDLCPAVTLDDIVDEIRTAVIYIYNHAAELGIDRDRLFISGHSAGGHLTAMMLRQDWMAHGLPKDVFKGAVPVSGVFDPEPVTHISVNEDVRLDPEMARRNSALSEPPQTPAPVIAVVGGREPEGFHVLSQDYVALCRDAGIAAEYLSIPDFHHFSVIEEVFRAGSDTFRKMLAQMT